VPRPGLLQAIGWAVLYLFVGFASMVALTWLGVALFGRVTLAESLVLQTVAGLVGFGLGTWLIGFRALGLTLQDLRWWPVAGAARGFGSGGAVGMAAAGATIGLSVAFGGAAFVPDQGNLGDYAFRVGLTLLLLAPAALLEELAFRGVAQVVLARAIGRVRAILLLSVGFAAAHLSNPNVSPLGLANITVAGVLLGFGFYASGGIWTAWGLHLGWNAALAALDAPVSGLPFQIPLIDYAPGGPAWLTGAKFGPEGGLLATLALAGACVVAWRWCREEGA
jgi:membrane protease YdiL (CAAX protease family)